MTKVIPPLVRKLSAFIPFTEQESDALHALHSESVELASGMDLLHEGQRGSRGYIVIEGWAYCYKSLEDGGRQILSFQLAGDFLGLRSILLNTSDHSFSTLTRCTLATVDQEKWQRLFQEFPRVGTAILWAIARDEAMLAEHLVRLGRRSAEQRTGHLLCELGQRLQYLGYAGDNGFDCPIPQTMLADALGLSVVHLNRSLRKLREAGLVTRVNGTLRITDLRALMEHSDFDNEYMQ